MLDLTEFNKLEAYLKEKGAFYNREDNPGFFLGLERFGEHHQIIVFSDEEKKKRLWDAIISNGSFGRTEGLLEVMGRAVVRKSDGDSVCGHLTAQDVIDRLEGRA